MTTAGSKPLTAIPAQTASRVSAYRDGRVYSWPRSLAFADTHYTRVAFEDGLVFKMPTRHALAEYERFVVREEIDSDAIRRNERIERPSNFCELLDRFPDFRGSSQSVGSTMTHWLALHRLQYARLQDLPEGSFRIPEARFVFLSRRTAFGRKVTAPCLVQEHATGIDLSEMLATADDEYGNEQVSYVRTECEPHLPTIGKAIRTVAESEWSDHINWYVRNFFFSPATGTLDYIDLKPSTIFGRHRNDINLNALMRDFARDPAYCQ